ncbi:MAG: hypothetical protein COU40_00530 [Candidatus Moranbacteria bacterium CG10_big_fil_rev_8_21_14_0_10_35_21]|nr:MAG: hypothetical protein COU40_00530 [Candidatus Moranbacteria bacterium CG10_big_fil_rev_8_21_14_0_10_35_21]PJA88841.1 MAG: hypothetical protein CO139_01000 [Candidatus Moranbacteria bacterium CG_4_9_14_3_um_filter_36_9]
MKIKKRLLLLGLLFLTLVFISKAYAAVDSACDKNNKNCDPINYEIGLKNQCEPEYGEEDCLTLSDYLSAMKLDCETGNDVIAKKLTSSCSKISSGGIYGNAAAAFAEGPAKFISYAEDIAPDPNKNKNDDVASDSNENTNVDILKDLDKIGLPNPDGGIRAILMNLLNWLLGLVGVVALIGFVISGVQYIIASGNDEMMETAKKNMLYSVAGITLVLASFVIIQAIQYALEAKGVF